MKKISYLLSALSMCLLFVACSEDTDRIFYYPTNTEATFGAAKGSYVFGVDDAAEYNLTISRTNPNGQATIEISNSDTDGLFTIPSTVEFADGESEATINVKFDRSIMAAGVAYDVTVNLPQHPITGKPTAYKLSVRRDYTWEYFAEGSIKSYFVQGEAVLYRGQEDQNAYKLKDLYAEGYDFVFVVKEGVLTMFESSNSRGYTFVTGIIHSNPAYGMASVDVDPDPQYTYVDLEQKKIVLSNYYYCAAGGWGWKDDVFTW